MTSNEQQSEAPKRKGIHVLARYTPAMREVGAIICRSLFAPLFILLLVVELRDGYDNSSLSGAICRGGLFLLPAICFTLVLSQAMRKQGLVARFFNWSEKLTTGLRSCIRYILWVALPCQFFYVVFQTFDLGKWNDSLGRLCFVASMLALACGLGRAARAMRKWVQIIGPSEIHVSTRIYCWMVFLSVLAPLLICGMSLTGFHYGAEEMGRRLIASILFALLISVLTGLFSHLLLVTQFKVKLRRLASEKSDDAGSIDTDAIDINDISAQVNRLLSVTALVGLIVLGWSIWGSVFPANSYLDLVELWPGPHNEVGDFKMVTLRHLLTSLGLIGLTFVLSRNLPGLLEITLLERLPLDRGGRYAISFVVRYIVGIAGILLTFQLLGFSWNSVQYLAAGLTLGLGFGLQEIFANLVSGIIILIERPIRVGDFVTVNGTSGTVIRMQLRATTIQDFDHRELIVPNKKFITEDVMNWTLTDQRSRLIFQIGIAYGSDTKLAEQKLLSIADNHPRVEKDPKPVVVFSQFGDSTLNFELRVHIPHREIFSQVQHEINMEIDRVFREEQIEIAFPQQDLHIRSGGKELLQELIDTDSADTQSTTTGKSIMPAIQSTTGLESGTHSPI